MVQRLLQDSTQNMNPLIRCTLNHIKLKRQNFLEGIDFDIVQDEDKRLLNINQGRLWLSSTILTLAIVSINIILLQILIPCALKMREQLSKFRVSQTRHGQQKLGTLFDLMVGKRHLIRLEEENGMISRVPNKKIMFR